MEADLIRARSVRHNGLILFSTFLTLPFCFNAQLFKPVFKAALWGCLLSFFMWRPLIMNETEVSEESEEWWWYSGGGCAPPWRGNREEVRQCCVSLYSMFWTHNNPSESLSLFQLCLMKLELKALAPLEVCWKMQPFSLWARWVTNRQRVNLEPTFAARNGVTFPFFCGFPATFGTLTRTLYSVGAWLTGND